jgi:hypothetical protein
MTRQTSFGGSELAVILPGTWAAIPIDDSAAAEKRISALVKSQVGRSDRLAKVRRDVRSQLQSLVSDAQGSEAFSLALSMEILPGVPFPASMIMSRENWPAAAHPPATDGTDAGAASAAGDAHGDDTPDTAVDDRIARVFPGAEIFDFTFGQVARTSSVASVRYDEESAPQLVVDYRFAAPDDEHVIRVHINAPMAELPELYLELFDAIVDSITFREPLPVRS